MSSLLFCKEENGTVNHVEINVRFAAADPEFGFCGKLKDKKGKTKRKLELKCKVDDPNAKVKWFKDGKEIKQSDPRYFYTTVLCT